MKDTIITTINDIEIVITSEMLVPIKPICEALGVAPNKQIEKIKGHPILGSVNTLRVSTGADGKQYEMACLPFEYVFGWLFTIHPDNVRTESRDKLIAYQRECYQALFDHFARKHINYQERELSFERTITLQKELADLRVKVERTGADFERYLEVEQQLRHEKAVRKSLTAESLTAIKSLFD